MLTEVLSRVAVLSQGVARSLGVMWPHVEGREPGVGECAPRWTSPTDMAALGSVVCVPPSPRTRGPPAPAPTDTGGDRGSESGGQECDVVRAGLPCCLMDEPDLTRGAAPAAPLSGGGGGTRLHLPLTEVRCDSDNDSGLVSCGDSDHAQPHEAADTPAPPFLLGDSEAPVLAAPPTDSPVLFRPDFEHAASIRQHREASPPAFTQHRLAPADALWPTNRGSRFEDQGFGDLSRRELAALSDGTQDASVFPEPSPVADEAVAARNLANATLACTPPTPATGDRKRLERRPEVRASGEEEEEAPRGDACYLEGFQYPPPRPAAPNPFDATFKEALDARPRRFKLRKVRTHPQEEEEKEAMR